MNIAVYGGSFDPIHNGHLSVIRSAVSVFDRLIVAVAVDRNKTAMFTLPERMNMIKKAIRCLGNVVSNIEIEVHEQGMLVDFAAERNAAVLVRGIRTEQDASSELRLARINVSQPTGLLTVLIPAGNNEIDISSSALKELVRLGGNVESWAPDFVISTVSQRTL